MRAWASCWALLASAVLLAAQPSADWRISSRPTRLAVHAVVDGQLAALQAGRFDVAYTFAARGIREQFSAAVFAEMIRRGYAPLLGHRARRLGLVRDDERRAYVDVTLVDAQNRPIRYRYELTREGADWRIAGVVALPGESGRGDT
jgi:hypothetical protein